MCNQSCLSTVARLSGSTSIKADSTVKAVPGEDCLGPVETLYDWIEFTSDFHNNLLSSSP